MLESWEFLVVSQDTWDPINLSINFRSRPEKVRLASPHLYHNRWNHCSQNITISFPLMSLHLLIPQPGTPFCQLSHGVFLLLQAYYTSATQRNIPAPLYKDNTPLRSLQSIYYHYSIGLHFCCWDPHLNSLRVGHTSILFKKEWGRVKVKEEGKEDGKGKGERGRKDRCLVLEIHMISNKKSQPPQSWHSETET